MATLTITNITSPAVDVPITELYTKVPASGSITVTRFASDLPRMTTLQARIADGSVTLAVTPTADELASGLLSAPDAVGADDFQAVASTVVAAPVQTLYKSFVSGGTSGTADVVTVYAVNTLPYKIRVLDSYARISTAVAASMTVETVAAGGGTVVATFDMTSLGKVTNTSPVNASTVLTPGSTIGLFIRRADRNSAGEVVLTVRRES